MPGEYVLSFRWDCEQTPQIWAGCSDIISAPHAALFVPVGISLTTTFASLQSSAKDVAPTFIKWDGEAAGAEKQKGQAAPV